MADSIFNLHNLGVNDVLKEIKAIVEALFKYKETILEHLTEVQTRDWIWKVYCSLVEASGIKNASSNTLSRR